MTGRRETPHTHAAPTGMRLVVPDLNVCTPGYWLGRTVGQLVADVAGGACTTRKVAVTADV
jgi:hypothetical protein